MSWPRTLGFTDEPGLELVSRMREELLTVAASCVTTPRMLEASLRVSSNELVRTTRAEQSG